jgi:glyoxylate reductase
MSELASESWAQRRVFVSQEIVEDAVEVFEGTGITMDVRRDHRPLPAEELRATAAEYDGLICLLTDRIDAELLAAFPQLRRCTPRCSTPRGTGSTPPPSRR